MSRSEFSSVFSVRCTWSAMELSKQEAIMHKSQIKLLFFRWQIQCNFKSNNFYWKIRFDTCWLLLHSKNGIHHFTWHLNWRQYSSIYSYIVHFFGCISHIWYVKKRSNPNQSTCIYSIYICWITMLRDGANGITNRNATVEKEEQRVCK